MNHLTFLILLSIFGLFASILFLMEIGRWSGARTGEKGPRGAGDGTGVIDAAIFSLMGLLVAFTFSGAASRFDVRRQMIVEEANTIGTAYLRMDLLPAHDQPALREKFRQYVDARLAVYRKLPDLAAAQAELRRAVALQGQIWTQAVLACQETGSPAVMTLVMGSLNEMIDMASTRTEGSQIHPPIIIPIMLVVLVLACSLLAGNLMAASKARSWVHIFGFALMLSLTVFVILDLEYPRIGTIRIDAWDRLLIDLRASMK